MTRSPALLRALVATLVLVVGITLVPSVARAELGETIDVTITSHSAPVIDLSDPDQEIEFSGTIINTSALRIRYVAVNFWHSTDPITDRAGLDAALESAPTSPEGERTRPWTEESGHVQVITRGDDAWFEPGARANFTVRATVGELGLPVDDAAYLLGVHVRGIPEQGTGNVTVGRGRILTVASQEPTQASVVVRMSAAPTQLADGDFVDASLVPQFSGRLATLLEAAEQPGRTLLIDPSLLAEAEALGGEHTVAGVTSDGHEAAADWAERVRAIIDDGRAMRLPFADVDLARAIAADRFDEVFNRAEATLEAHPLVSDLLELDLAHDLGNSATAAGIAVLQGAGVELVIADNVAGNSTGVVTSAPRQQTGIGPGGRDSRAQQLSRRLTEELIATSTPVHVLRTPDDVREVGSLPHTDVVEFSNDATGGPQVLPGDDAAVPHEALQTKLDEIRSRNAFLDDLTGTTGDDVEAIAARAWSSQFISEADAVAYVEAHLSAEIDPAGVEITVARQFVMGARISNFPMNITNTLPLPVTVRVTFDSESPQRIQVPATEFMTVQPGENLAISVAPEASANGVVLVHAQLETMGGQKFGPEVPIEITATNLGRVGWIIIVISGAVVLGGTFLRIRAVRAENAEENSEQGQ